MRWIRLVLGGVNQVLSLAVRPLVLAGSFVLSGLRGASDRITTALRQERS